MVGGGARAQDERRGGAKGRGFPQVLRAKVSLKQSSGENRRGCN